MAHDVSVVIATTCQQQRATVLRRAVDSVLEQREVPVRLLVVVNGPRCDPHLLRELRRDKRLHVFYRTQASLPGAILFGRTQVRTEYFSFLDDDDWLLPGALALRLDAIEHPHPVDFVVTNGYVQRGSDIDLFVPAPGAVINDPLGATIDRHWLASAAGLYRSSTITPAFFDGATKYYEWTYLAFKLLLARRTMRFITECTYHISDTPRSLSKDVSLDSLTTAITMLASLRPTIPKRHATRYAMKLSAAYHALADHYWRNGNAHAAWRPHWKSLHFPRGLVHLAFTRRLLASYMGRT